MVNVWFRILQDQIKMLIQDLLYKIAVSIRANVFFSRCNFKFFRTESKDVARRVKHKAPLLTETNKLRL